MFLKNVFNTAVQKTGLFFNRLEASQLRSRIEMAKAGYLMVHGAGRYSAVVPLKPEEAKQAIEIAEKRLAELKLAEQGKPSPARP